MIFAFLLLDRRESVCVREGNRRWSWLLYWGGGIWMTAAPHEGRAFEWMANPNLPDSAVRIRNAG